MNKRCWVFKEAFETLAEADQYFDITIVDVLYVILNWMERKRNPAIRKTMFFTTNI